MLVPKPKPYGLRWLRGEALCPAFPPGCTDRLVSPAHACRSPRGAHGTSADAERVAARCGKGGERPKPAGKSSVPDCRLLRADTVALLLGSPGDPGFPGGTPCSGLCLTATGLRRKKLVRKERLFLNVEERRDLNFISWHCGDRLQIFLLLSEGTQNGDVGTSVASILFLLNVWK